MLAWHKSDEQGPRAVRAHYYGKSDAEAAGSVLPAGGRLSRVGACSEMPAGGRREHDDRGLVTGAEG